MEVRVDARNISLPPGGARELSDRVARAFSQVESAVRHLHVVLKDINGPRGGRDKECVLHIALDGGGDLVITETRATAKRALMGAIHRGRRSVRREMRRRRGHRRAPQASLEWPALA